MHVQGFVVVFFRSQKKKKSFPTTCLKIILIIKHVVYMNSKPSSITLVILSSEL